MTTSTSRKAQKSWNGQTDKVRHETYNQLLVYDKKGEKMRK